MATCNTHRERLLALLVTIFFRTVFFPCLTSCLFYALARCFWLLLSKTVPVQGTCAARL